MRVESDYDMSRRDQWPPPCLAGWPICAVHGWSEVFFLCISLEELPGCLGHRRTTH